MCCLNMNMHRGIEYFKMCITLVRVTESLSASSNKLQCWQLPVLGHDRNKHFVLTELMFCFRLSSVNTLSGNLDFS